MHLVDLHVLTSHRGSGLKLQTSAREPGGHAGHVHCSGYVLITIVWQCIKIWKITIIIIKYIYIAQNCEKAASALKIQEASDTLS